MNHEEFVEAYRQGFLQVHIDESASKALLHKFVEKKYRYPYLLGKWIFLISIPIGVGLVLWVNKGIGIVTIILGYLLSRSYKKSPSEIVLEKALKDKQLYNDLVESQMLRVEHIH